MYTKYFTLLILSFALISFTQAQRTADSATASQTLKKLFAVCKNIDFANPETANKGLFYKAAQYIVYRGTDKKRAWKTFANYSKAEDKLGVDGICTRINGSINQSSSYRIVKYLTQKESEGTWHVLMVRYQQNSEEKENAFAFLKIGKRFGLGDID